MTLPGFSESRDLHPVHRAAQLLVLRAGLNGFSLPLAENPWNIFFSALRFGFPPNITYIFNGANEKYTPSLLLSSSKETGLLTE
jgi:hypothetical protein